MVMRNATKHILSAGTALVLAAAPAWAATIASDGFGDGDRNNDAASDITDASPIDNALDTGLAWWKAKNDGGQDVTIQNDDGVGQLNGSLAMLVDGTAGDTTQNPGVAANFPAVTLASGDTLTLSFDARFLIVPPFNTDRTFRYGIFNSTGVLQTGDNDPAYSSSAGSEAGVALWGGYMGRVDVGSVLGTNDDFAIVQDDFGGSFLNANNYFDGSGPNTAAAIVDTLPRTFTLGIERVGDELVISGSVDGVLLSRSTADEPVGPLTFTFDSLAIGINKFSGATFLVDNVNVDYTPVPEPASLALLGLGGLALFRRQR